MPAPLGQQERNRKFLLRMTDDEDTYARARARRLGTSLNDAITGFIRDAMAAAPEPVRPEPERPAPSPQHKRRRPLRTDRTAEPAPEPIPGQTSITDPDQ